MRLFFLPVAAIALTACKSDKPTLVLDQSTVDERLAHLNDDVPSCRTLDPTAARYRRSTPMVRGTLQQVGSFIEAMRLLRAEPIPYAGVGSTGSCGGAIDVSYEHENGITDYLAQLDGYCVTTDDGDVVYNGTIKAKEVGTPSDAGPIVESLSLSSDGPVTVTQDGETFEIAIEDIETTYGVPSEFEPGFPDAANPDKTTVGAVRITFGDGREDYVEDLEMERVDGVPAKVTILSGRSGSSVDGFATVRTAANDPLIVDVYNGGTIEGGTIELEGKKGGVVTISPRENDPAMYDLTLDGQPTGDTVDCTSADAATQESWRALLQALPIY